MKARLIRTGNSRKVRLPKRIIEGAGLTEEVKVCVRDGAVVIQAAVWLRAGWAQAAGLARQRDDDRLLGEPTATHFDRRKWQWK
jgi:antitoxin component of MazEF toxin-antitoxin module